MAHWERATQMADERVWDLVVHAKPSPPFWQIHYISLQILFFKKINYSQTQNLIYMDIPLEGVLILNF